MTVESEAGNGATFRLYLPRTAEGASVAASEHVEEKEGSGEGLCILIVEDNPEVGTIARTALEELGYATVLAHDAAHALGELKTASNRFHAVFSDVVMPGMSGVELGREIRSRFPALPVVLTSGYSNALAEEGHHGFELIRKPYSVEELARTLRKVTAPESR